MRRRPGGVRRGKGAMVGGEGLGEGEDFGVAGVSEVDFEGGEGMVGGGRLMRVLNIYPIGIFSMCCANTTAVRASGKGFFPGAFVVQNLGINNTQALIKGGRQI